MPFKFKDVRKNLRKKGFTENKKRHHIYLHHCVDGKRTGPYTYLSHGKLSDEVGEDIVRAMKDQLKLTQMSHVRALVDCSLSGRAYVDLLKEAGVIPKS